MSDLMTMLPIYLFMLIPVWIPLTAMALGALTDAIKAPARAAATSRHAAPARRISRAGRPVPAGGTAR